MPDEEKDITEKIEVAQPSSKINIKVFLFGIPVFILQLVFVYYITANVLLNRHEFGTEAASQGNSEEAADTASVELGVHIYAVDDIIVNPDGNEGKRLLLTSVGFDVASEESLKELESKEILVKDIINSVLSGKKLKQLRQWSFRDSLRKEIASDMKSFLPGISINRVYFSKYIVQ